MSYSRWGDSCWYTFYSDSGSVGKENQVMACWLGLDQCVDWTYAEILELLDDSPNFKICQRYNCTITEAHELISYMKEFSADVESEIYL